MTVPVFAQHAGIGQLEHIPAYGAFTANPPSGSSLMLLPLLSSLRLLLLSPCSLVHPCLLLLLLLLYAAAA
jgi:hypothetical protein